MYEPCSRVDEIGPLTQLLPAGGRGDLWKEDARKPEDKNPKPEPEAAAQPPDKPAEGAQSKPGTVVRVEGSITEFLKTHPQAKIKAVWLTDTVPNKPDQDESQGAPGRA